MSNQKIIQSIPDGSEKTVVVSSADKDTAMTILRSAFGGWRKFEDTTEPITHECQIAGGWQTQAEVTVIHKLVRKN